MYESNTKPFVFSDFRTNPFVKNPNKGTSFKTNIVFGSLPIGNPADISLNVIEHIMEADVILVESHREFSRLMTRVNELKLRTVVDLQPGAVIYQFQFENDIEKANEVSETLIEASQNGKNVFIVSDEGSSVFLEPAQYFKKSLVERKIPYTVLPGPFSGISAITTSDFFIRQFFFGESLPGISQEQRKEVYSRMTKLGMPTVFLLTAVDARWCISELKEYLGDGWVADFQMSLTMENEKHIYGTFSEIIAYIDKNSHLFQKDDQDKKFSVVLYPDENMQILY